MKFFPTKINFNANILNLNLKGNIGKSNNSLFLNNLNLLLTKNQQKGLELDKDSTNNNMSLAYILLLLITSNEKIGQFDLMNKDKSVHVELKNNFSEQLNKLLNLLKKEIDVDPELKKLLINFKEYLNINEYKLNDGNDILKNIDKTNIGFNEIENFLFMKEKNNSTSVNSSNRLETNKLDKEIISNINNYIKDNYPELIYKVKNILEMKGQNKKYLDFHLKDILNGTQNSLNGKDIKLVVDKIDNLHEQVKSILENGTFQNKEEEVYNLKDIENQIVELQNKVFEVIKENKGSLDKVQVQKTIEQVVHNINLLQNRLNNIESELLKAGMDLPLNKNRGFLKSGGDKGFNHTNDFATAFQIRSIVLDNGTQGASVPVDSKFRDEIFTQIERGIFKNLGDGTREVSLKLHPPELGTLKVVMEVHNREVSLVLHTEHRDVADALNKHIANFEKSFEQQGLKVVKVEVKNDLFSGGENSLRDFTGAREQGQNNSQTFKRRNIFDFSLLGDGEIPSIDHENVSTLVRMNSNSLYVIA